MQVTETNTSGLKREYKVVVPANDLKTKVDSKLVELGQKVKLDGFRPGKVPMAVPCAQKAFGRAWRNW